MYASYNVEYKYDTKILVVYLINITNIYNQGETFILNKNNKSNFSLVEKVIYDLSSFYIDAENDKYFIEFWFKNQTGKLFHYDCDEYDSKINLNANSKKPYKSIILYLNDSDEPTIITNIQKDENIKDIEDIEDKICISYPKTLKTISFDGGKLLHGVCTNNKNIDRNILIINIWDNYKPLYVQYFNNDSLIYKYSLYYNCKISNNNYSTCESLFTFKKNKIFESQDNNLVNRIYTKIKTSNICDYNIIETLKHRNEYNDFIFTTKKEYNLEIKSFSITSFLKQKVCEWIINEAENQASITEWNTKRHINYPTTDIPLEDIKSVFNLFIHYFETIKDIIMQNYNIDQNFNINIYDCFIVKYEYDKQNKLELHIDESDITVNILLSNDKDFNGGGTYFEKNDSTIKLKQGDILIHNGNLRHSAKEITSGKRYVLVAFIKLIAEDE